MEIRIIKNYKDEVTAVDFIANDGKTSFSVEIINDVEIEVRSVNYVKFKDNIYDNKLNIQPMASNSILITKPLYE